ncbi:TetR family transcriptional regulator [Kaistia dalseonensis]|uniref:AcrR family transcriptional regulator n=1 Tax=Kaistia dalseonensis TaxID=410840 RepID=A0ABU0H753_9HYPH|nr:TetR/AcrR family transcriptional regulator [Kaistia dalseonensis]MCX5495551.1 TetR family transcriptional regulator [Kaistia dalseonensis]MDQ0438143.1 AcrR family transcriptional regulator [Kaistia dalseonensis]
MTVKESKEAPSLRGASVNALRQGHIKGRPSKARNDGIQMVTRAASAPRARKSAVAADGSGEEVPAAKAPRGRLKAVAKGDATLSASDTLLNAALDLFAEQNYSTVTIKDIARATGFNPSLIYYYFGSKEELFLQAVEMTVATAFEKFDRIRDHANTPDAVISSWIEIHVTEFALLQKLAKVSLDYASTRSRNERIDKAIRQFYDKESVVLGQAIREGVESGMFRPTKPKQMAVFISTFLDGALFRNMMFPEFNYRTAIRNMRTIILDRLRTGTEI